jgi:hypothetical protein
MTIDDMSHYGYIVIRTVRGDLLMANNIPFDGIAFKANLLKHLELLGNGGLPSGAFIYARICTMDPCPPEVTLDSLNLTPKQERACGEVEQLMRIEFSICNNYENGIVCIGGRKHQVPQNADTIVTAIEYLELLATVVSELDPDVIKAYESVLDIIYEKGVRPATQALVATRRHSRH